MFERPGFNATEQCDLPSDCDCLVIPAKNILILQKLKIKFTFFVDSLQKQIDALSNSLLATGCLWKVLDHPNAKIVWDSFVVHCG